MGNLHRFDIRKIREDFNLESFIETGLGSGAGLKFASTFPFSSLHSCDIMYDLVKPLRETFSVDHRIKIYVSESALFLPYAIQQAQGNILFWLDAHFPGADLLGRSYWADPMLATAIPLEQELRQIRQLRPNNRDVFLIDDLRIYEDGPFSGGNWPDRRRFGTNGIGFVHELFGSTHQVLKDFRDEGYIVLLPNAIAG